MSLQLKVLTVADLHRNQKLYELLAEAVKTHQPDLVALVSDFLDASDNEEGKLTAEESARSLARLESKSMVLVRGNHEAVGWERFVQAWQDSGRTLKVLDGESIALGPLVVVGFPCGMMVDSPPRPEAWLPNLMGRHGSAARALWLMHEPPYGTPLSERFGYLCGHAEWRDAIERYSPRVVVFGHDHRTPIKRNQWHCQLGTTTCVNVGQSVAGPLRYATIELGFDKHTPCLPTKTVVTAYPDAASLVVPLGSIHT
jgi:Icc-related predicted phosphoesterase